MPHPAPGLVSMALAAVLGASAGPAAAASAQSCFNPPSLGTSWMALDDHTILVRDGARAFRITTNSCPRLADALPRITVVLNGSSNICTPHDAKIYVSDSADRAGVPCFAQSIDALSLDQARALEQAHRHH